MEQNREPFNPKLPNEESAQKREYTGVQKLLLAVTLLMGLVFATLIMGTSYDLQKFAVPYALFWAIYLAGYYFAVPKARTNKAAWFLLACVALLFLRYAAYGERVLGTLNLLAIPLLLMLHAVVGAYQTAPGCEGEYAIQYFLGFFVKPFAHIARFFGAAGSLFQKKEAHKRSGVLLGLLVGLPLAALVFALLAQADSVLYHYTQKFFAGWSLGDVFWRTIGGLVVAFLFYSFLYGTAWVNYPARKEPYPKKLEPSVLHTVMTLLLLVYAIFGYVQFFYLTGLSGLPEGLTYSEYAVRGFNELLAVALINLGLYALTLRFEKEHKAKRVFLLLLLVATALVLLSGITRLFMYINAYGLTMGRILPAWFIFFLGAATALCAARLFVQKLPLLRAVTAVFLVFYLALNALNLDAMIARSVLARADERGGLREGDANYLRYELSQDAAPVLKASKYKEEIYYDVDAEDLG